MAICDCSDPMHRSNGCWFEPMEGHTLCRPCWKFHGPGMRMPPPPLGLGLSLSLSDRPSITFEGSDWEEVREAVRKWLSEEGGKL